MKKTILITALGILASILPAQQCTTIAQARTYSVHTDIQVTKVTKDTINKKHEVTIELAYNIQITGTGDTVTFHAVYFTWNNYIVMAYLPFTDSTGTATTTTAISNNKNRKIFDLTAVDLTTIIRGNGLADTTACAVVLNYKPRIILENEYFADYWEYQIINNRVHIIGEQYNFAVHNLQGQRVQYLSTPGIYVITNLGQHKTIYYTP